MEPTGKPPAPSLESVLDETLKKPMDWEMIDTFAKLQELEEAARIIEDPITDTALPNDTLPLSDRFKPDPSAQ